MFSIRDDVEVLEKYNGYKTNILVDFKNCECEPQRVSPQHLLMKCKGKLRGCPGCRDRRSSETRSELHSVFLDWIWKNRPGELFLLEKYRTSHTKIKVLWDNCFHITEIMPYSIKEGNGCNKCSNNISKASQEWLNKIEKENNIILKREYKFNPNNKKQKADGYDPVTNTIYEFYGDYWHGNPNTKKIFKNKNFHKLKHKKTLEREELIKKLGYSLITIWENDYTKIIVILSILTPDFLSFFF